MPEPRKILKVIGRPGMSVKVYDRIQQNAYIKALCDLMRNRRMPSYGFAGVANIYQFDGEPSADFQIYGRNGMQNMDHIFPYSVNLETGEDFPPHLGRACLDETILFGKEAELFKKIWQERGKVDKETIRIWRNEFAV